MTARMTADLQALSAIEHRCGLVDADTASAADLEQMIRRHVDAISWALDTDAAAMEKEGIDFRPPHGQLFELGREVERMWRRGGMGVVIDAGCVARLLSAVASSHQSARTAAMLAITIATLCDRLRQALGPDTASDRRIPRSPSNIPT